MNRIFFKESENKRHYIKLAVNFIKSLYIIFSFFVLDFGLRWIIKDNLTFKDYIMVPNLLTLCWSLIFMAVIWCFSKKIGRIIYGILYYVWAAYIIIQKGFYMIFGRFLFLNDFTNSGEAAHYTDFAFSLLNLSFITFIVVILAVGIVGIILIPEIKLKGKVNLVKLIPFAVGAVGLFVVPMIFYPSNFDLKSWNAWESPSFEYNKFSSSVPDMELTGIYHFVARDLQIKAISKLTKDDEAKIQYIDEFFDKREEKTDNSMTGVFEGKNVIIVMMESLDDWVVNEENTPTIWNMMQNGINFTNMYTPLYTVGCTFNTEFAFNTSNFPYSNGTTVYTLSGNHFKESLANLFTEKNYITNSFHKGNAEFYKRGVMHQAFGYTKYNSYLEYTDNEKEAEIDTFLPECDELYNEMTKSIKEENKPFFDFIVTYSAHLPYSADNHLSAYALEKYPEYNKPDRPMEVNYISAQARITDDMFKELTERLEADGLLDDTVIIGYADHYSFGITDSDLLTELSAAAGSDIVYKTPAFIYCKGYDNHFESSKVMQTIDFVPTISNLFSLDCPETLGRDVFDESYPGYVIFPNNSWLTDKAYFKGGQIVYNNGMTEEEISEMNGFVQEFYTANDYILDTDYYKKYYE